LAGVFYFAYGSNMDPTIMLERCPSARDPLAGRLDGFRIEFNVYSDNWGGGAANLEPDERSSVWGVVWEVDSDDLSRLDTFQGHPTFYRRERVVVHSDGEPLECTTYRVAHQKGYVRPTEEYLSKVRHAMAHHRLPLEAVETLERAARPPRPRIST
jgi:gamma-glutamylcyclotransferase (GGCT)/AIG2-like uncharacterized protein YtfP